MTTHRVTVVFEVDANTDSHTVISRAMSKMLNDLDVFCTHSFTIEGSVVESVESVETDDDEDFGSYDVDDEK